MKLEILSTPSLIPPKLLRDVLLDYRHRVYLLLIIGLRIHLVVFLKMRDVFGMSEVLFPRIYY